MKQQSLKIFSKEETGPYELPKGWRWVRLGEVCKINKNSRNPAKEIPDKEFLYIDITSVEGGTGEIKEIKKILGENAPSRARRVIHQDDVIMSTVRPYLKAFAVIPPEYDNQICSTGFAVLSCNSEILPKFLLYALFSEVVIEQCNKMMIGAHYPALNNEQVSEIKIPLPPLPEQKRIVARIEALFSKIDEIKRLRKEANDLAKTLLQSALHEVFSKADEKGWRWVRLGEVVETTSGGTPQRSIKEYWENGTIPWVKSGELENNIISKTEEKITLLGLENSNARLFQKGTLIVAMYGATVGKTAILGIDAATNQAVCGIFPKIDLINRDYIRYFFIYKRPELVKNSFGGAQPNISQTVIRDLLIPLPPLPEQKRIVAYLDQISEKQKILLKIYENIDNQITELKQSILNKAFRGGLLR